MPDYRLPTAFHETFTLNRPALTQVLDVVIRTDVSNQSETKTSLLNQLKLNTSLGNNYIKAMPKYAVGMGLLDVDYQPTAFAHAVIAHDSMLDSSETLWLAHYFLSASSGPGPLFWHELGTTYFRVGSRFTRQEVGEEIAALYLRSEGKSLSASSIKSTRSVFLGTYTKPDGLGNLGILYQEGDEYVVAQPEAPSAWAFGYALMDDWERKHTGRLSINLDELTHVRGLGSLFLMDEAAVIASLSELQRAGVVELYRSARPYQLLLLSHDREAMLRKVYGVDDLHPIA